MAEFLLTLLLNLLNLQEYLCMLAWREGYFGRFMFSVLALRVGVYSARLLDMHSDFGCVSAHRLCSTKLFSSLKAVWVRNNFTKFLFSLPHVGVLF